MDRVVRENDRTPKPIGEFDLPNRPPLRLGDKITIIALSGAQFEVSSILSNGECHLRHTQNGKYIGPLSCALVAKLRDLQRLNKS